MRYSKKDLLNIIKQNSANQLLKEVLWKYPDIANVTQMRKIREDLLLNLMTRYVLGNITKTIDIDELDFPLEYLPSLIKDNDKEAAEVLASVISFQKYNVPYFNASENLNNLIELLLPKISRNVVKNKILEMDDDLDALDYLKIAHYFE